MKIFYWQEILSGKFADFFENGCALTVGSFDGPHNGHKILFSDVISFANSHNILKGIITFSQSISKIKHRDEFPGNITTLHQRLSFFEKKSFDFVVIIDFTENFSKISGADFFTILSEKMNLKFIAEGLDFKCGFKGNFTSQEINAISKTLGFSCKFEALVHGKENTRISSSLIRDNILHADFKKAEQMLGNHFVLDLYGSKIENCGKIYKISGFTQVLPCDGVYNVIVNTFRALRSCLEVKSKEILVDLSFNEISRIRSIIFINKE